MGLLSSLRFKAEDVPMQGQTVQGRIATAYFERIPGVGGPYRLVIGVEVLSPPDMNVELQALAAWAHADGTGPGYAPQWKYVYGPINGTVTNPNGDNIANGHTTINGVTYGLTQFLLPTPYQFSDPPGTAFQVQALLRNITLHQGAQTQKTTDQVNTTPYGPITIPSGDSGASPSNPWTPLPVPTPTPPPPTPPANNPPASGGGGAPSTGGGGPSPPSGSAWTWPFIHAILAFLHLR